MTNKKTEKVMYEKIMYETHDGQIFDVDGAFERHPAITPGKANIDLTVNIERHTRLYFELRLSDKAMASLVQILNAAPGTLTVHTKTDTLTKKDGTPEVITYVTLTSNTSTEGAYYMAEILNQLSEENG